MDSSVLIQFLLVAAGQAQRPTMMPRDDEKFDGRQLSVSVPVGKIEEERAVAKLIS